MQTLINFKNFIDELQMNNSRNYKLDILRKYKDDKAVRYYLNFLYNPYITTGISDRKLYKEVNKTVDNIPENFSVIDLLNYIKDNNTGSDYIIGFIQKYKNDIVDVDLYETLDALITKNLPLGIDVKSINKCIPNLIPEFNVMLANKYFEKPEVVEGKEFTLTTKIDGGRIIAIKKNGVAKFYTRQGQEYEGLVDLKEEMEKYMPDNICLDGEITLLDPYVYDDINIYDTGCSLFDDDINIVNKRKLTSKEQYKKTMMITRRDGEKHGVKMLVFDIMSAEEFESQECNIPYVKRRAKLDYIFKFNNGNNHNYVYFTKLPILYTGSDVNMIPEYLNDAINNDEEGIMININNAPYDFKRTNNLLKVKKMNDLDLKCIGFEEGTNRHAGRLGALLVDYKGYTVKVGIGFSDELREEIWNNKDSWLGRTIVVQYFEETQNQQGGISLRFPVYIDYRTDK